MDEYVGIEPSHKESYHYFMNDNLFSHVDINKENIHILNGMAKDLAKECEDYEKKIKSYGKIHLFVGGIGVDGHIAFNEPGSSLSSLTRVKTLTYDTKVINSRFFDNDLSKTPSQALSVGVKTIMDSEEVLILVNGTNKAKALAESVEGSVSSMCTLSILQFHPKAIITCDEMATYELKVGTVKYFNDIEKENII